MRDAGVVSGAGLQPLVCEMLRSDRSVGSFGRAIVRSDRSAGRSFGRIVRLAGQRAGRKSVRSDRSFGRTVRPGEGGRRKSEQYQGRKSVRSSVRSERSAG